MVSAIKFRKGFSKFMIPIALLENLAVKHLFRVLNKSGPTQIILMDESINNRWDNKTHC